MGHFGSVVLPALPENLVSKPTLVWLLRNTRPAPQRVEASYLTAGISWKADYVMLINAADTRADLTGWVTINNQSGATYRDAALKLVAGDVNRAASRDDARRAMEMAAKAASPAAAEREFKSEGFFEYHLYTLDGRTTIKESQTKQLTLLSAADIPVDKRFIYYGAASYHRTQYGVPISNQKVGVYLDIRNTKENRLGMPLPKGKVRVYKADTVGEPAAHRRGLDRPHPEGRAGADQDGRGLRRGRRARAEGLEADRRAISTRSSGRSRCATTRRRPSPSR